MVDDSIIILEIGLLTTKYIIIKFMNMDPIILYYL